MNIKTEAKIHVFFDNFIDLMNFSFLFKLIAYPLLFIVLTEMFCNNFNFPLPTIYVTTLSIILLLSTLILLLLTLVIYVVLDSLFFKIDFEYNQFLLCCLLLKKHHSSSKLKLELNKLKQAIENNSQLYNDLNKVDFPYINKFISRYKCYKNIKFNSCINKKLKNNRIIQDDLLQLALSEPNIQQFRLEHNTSSFEQLDDVLGNLVKEQIKQKTDKTYLVN